MKRAVVAPRPLCHSLLVNTDARFWNLCFTHTEDHKLARLLLNRATDRSPLL